MADPPSRQPCESSPPVHLTPYGPLTGSETFRLAIISPGQWADPVRCKLVQREFDGSSDGGSYKALSYAWGAPAIKETIYLVDVPVEVTWNLFCILRCLRKVDEDVVLWIDALCINQQDDDERNQQVKLMQKIYRNAQEVIVFMGDGRNHRTQRSGLTGAPTFPKRTFLGDERDDAYLVEFLETCRSTKLKRLTSPGYTAFLAISLVRLFSDELKFGQSCQKLSRLPKHVRRHLFKCLRSFLACSWWDRTWVIQEIAVSTAATVQYGTVSAPWRIFTGAVSVLSSNPRNLASWAGLEPENCQVLALLSNQLSTLERTRQQWHSDGGAHLLHLLQEFSNRQASDDCDKVYGLLGLAKNRHIIEPDYRLGILEVYRSTALALIRSDSSLACWVGDQRRKNQRNLPSWIPDWSVAFDPADRRRMDLIDLYNASRGWSLRFVDHEIEYWTLVLGQMTLLLDNIGPSRRLPSAWRPNVLRYMEGLPVGPSVSSNVKSVIEELKCQCERLAHLCSTYSELFLVGPQPGYLRVRGFRGNSASAGCVLLEDNVHKRALSLKARGGFFRLALEMCTSRPAATNDVFPPPELPVCSYVTREDHPPSLRETSRFTARQNFSTWHGRCATSLSQKTFTIHTSWVGHVSCVGPRLLGFSNGEAARYNLTRWLRMAKLPTVSPSSSRSHGRRPVTETPYVNEALLQAFARTIIGAVIDDGHSCRKADVADLRALAEWLQKVAMPQQKHRASNYHTPPSPFYASIRRATDGRVFFVTETGIMGLGPASMQQKDEVHIFPGGRTHFVLRRVATLSPTDRYKLVGDCFLDTFDDVADDRAGQDLAPLKGSLPYDLLGDISDVRLLRAKEITLI